MWTASWLSSQLTALNGLPEERERSAFLWQKPEACVAASASVSPRHLRRYRLEECCRPQTPPLVAVGGWRSPQTQFFCSSTSHRLLPSMSVWSKPQGVCRNFVGVEPFPLVVSSLMVFSATRRRHVAQMYSNKPCPSHVLRERPDACCCGANARAEPSASS